MARRAGGVPGFGSALNAKAQRRRKNERRKEKERRKAGAAVPLQMRIYGRIVAAESETERGMQAQSTETSIQQDDWTLNTEQMIFMLQHHNPIEAAYEADDMESCENSAFRRCIEQYSAT